MKLFLFSLLCLVSFCSADSFLPYPICPEFSAYAPNPPFNCVLSASLVSTSASSEVTISNIGRAITFVSEDTCEIVSSNSGDSAEIFISGIDADGACVTETVTVAGTTTVELENKYTVINNMYNASTKTILGDIYAFAHCTVTSGIPQDNSKVMSKITAGKNCSENGFICIPTGYKGKIQKVTVSSVNDYALGMSTYQTAPNFKIYAFKSGYPKIQLFNTEYQVLDINNMNIDIPSGYLVEFTSPILVSGEVTFNAVINISK